MTDNIEFDVVPSGSPVEPWDGALDSRWDGHTTTAAPDGTEYAGDAHGWWLDSNRGHNFYWDGQGWSVEVQTDSGDLADSLVVDTDRPPTFEDVQGACRQWLLANPGLVASRPSVSPARRAVSWVRSLIR